ncbi:MAG: hypothetical protein IPN72_08395 [Saprospiraceae bacterium]|nr:hypothetical protein [Saprospiraceae bacterium]
MSTTSTTLSIYDQIKMEGKIEGRIEGRIEGKIEGKMEVKRDVVLKSFECGFQIELISKITELSTSEIQNILKLNNRV